jgi:hypothetical protein
MKPAHDLSQHWIVAGGRRREWRNCFQHVRIPSLPQLHFCGTDSAQPSSHERTLRESAIATLLIGCWSRKAQVRKLFVPNCQRGTFGVRLNRSFGVLNAPAIKVSPRHVAAARAGFSPVYSRRRALPSVNAMIPSVFIRTSARSGECPPTFRARRLWPRKSGCDHRPARTQPSYASKDQAGYGSPVEW